jgi:hypothetical protein
MVQSSVIGTIIVQPALLYLLIHVRMVRHVMHIA